MAVLLDLAVLDRFALVFLAADAFGADAFVAGFLAVDFGFDRDVPVEVDRRRRGAAFMPGTTSRPFSTTVPAALPATSATVSTAPDATFATLPATLPASFPTLDRIPFQHSGIRSLEFT